MRIVVKAGENANIRLWVPTGLVLNRVTALFIPAILEKQGITVTAGQAAAFVRAIKDSRRRFKDWVLVEVKSVNGEEVCIKL